MTTSESLTVRDVLISKCMDGDIHVAFEEAVPSKKLKLKRDSVALVMRNGVAGFSLVQNLEVGDRVLEFKDDSGRGSM